MTNSLTLILTPHGRLELVETEDASALDAELIRRLAPAFNRGSGHGLLQLGAGEVGAVLPAVFSYWREFSARFVTSLCALPDGEPGGERVPLPETAEIERLALTAPLMTGAEYLTPDTLRSLWQEIDEAFVLELAEAKCPVQEFLKRRNPAWNLVGRVHFNLAENRKDEAAPFAFLVTYTTQLSAHGKAQHLPLGQALREYAGAANKGRLVSLLLPVQRAAEGCSWLKTTVERGEIFHPLRWRPEEAFQFLSDVPRATEQAAPGTERPASGDCGPAKGTVLRLDGDEEPFNGVSQHSVQGQGEDLASLVGRSTEDRNPRA